MAISIVPDDPIANAIDLIVCICKDLYEACEEGSEAHFMLHKDFYALLPNAIEIWKETRHAF